jgi:hypothetical protein
MNSHHLKCRIRNGFTALLEIAAPIMENSDWLYSIAD